MHNPWTYFHDNQSQILGWTWTTVWLAVLPVVIGLAISLPLGWLAYRYRWTYPPLISITGLLYTIPSVVMFLVLPDLLGDDLLALRNVAVALTLYTVALLVRIVADGLASVSPDTLAAAAAMGYTGRQRLLAIQLPIALPVIGAGLRVAAVSNVSLISVASVIGTPALGELFNTGINDNQLTPVVLGLIMFVLLALIYDVLIVLGIRFATPWRRVVAAR